MLDRKVWEGKYVSKAEALAALDSPLLKDLRSNAINNRRRREKSVAEIQKNWGDEAKEWEVERLGRRRREKSVAEIQKNWGDEAKEWEVERLGENCLASMAAVSRRFKYCDAESMVLQITVSRLRTVKVGRGSTRRGLADLSEHQGGQAAPEKTAI